MYMFRILYSVLPVEKEPRKFLIVFLTKLFEISSDLFMSHSVL